MISFKASLLLLLSFCIVAFGQPLWGWFFGALAASIGFALFWWILLDIPEKGKRFCIAMGWFSAIQVFQLSWMLSHPYLYIYLVLFFCAWAIGAQFGLIALFIQRETIKKLPNLFTIAAFWTIFEWSRLFFLSGFPFNPVGLSLTGSLYSLQFASLGGIYLLSFWVILSNLMIVRMAVLNQFSWKRTLATISILVLPYCFGAVQLYWHQQKIQSDKTVSVLLIQPAKPVEEHLTFQSAEEYRLFAFDKWTHIFLLMQKEYGKKIDLIVLPEYLVPYGTYPVVFPLSTVRSLFRDTFGSKAVRQLPPLVGPYADYVDTYKGPQWLVNNAFLAQSLANMFGSELMVGLEDSSYIGGKKDIAYSTALHFLPENHIGTRYEKRILVPMGEYIPFTWCREIAAQYGIQGSFTCGTEAKVCDGKVPFSPSICYEETYGHLMREGRQKGAELIVNLTNDAWFPNSTLPEQHFYHARLRTVENGVPLVRACNTGVTCAIDSLGRVVARLDGSQWQAGVLQAAVPLYHYQTLYTKLGDFFIIGMSLCIILAQNLFSLLRFSFLKRYDDDKKS